MQLRTYKYIQCVRGGLTNTASNPPRLHGWVRNWLALTAERSESDPSLAPLPFPPSPPPLPSPSPPTLTILLLLQVDLLVLAAGRLGGHGDGKVISAWDSAAGTVATDTVTQHVVWLLTAPSTLWPDGGRGEGRGCITIMHSKVKWGINRLVGWCDQTHLARRAATETGPL